MTEELDQLRAERDDWKRDYEAVLLINRYLKAENKYLSGDEPRLKQLVSVEPTVNYALRCEVESLHKQLDAKDDAIQEMIDISLALKQEIKLMKDATGEKNDTTNQL